MADSHFCYHCNKEYPAAAYARHVRAVVTRLAAVVNDETGEEELPDFLEEFIQARIGVAPTEETEDEEL